MAPKRIEIIGLKFGRLLAVRELDPLIEGNGKKRRRVEVKCDCGATKAVDPANLTGGRLNSCGCLAADLGEQRSVVNPNATTQGSSAKGLFQFVDPSWKSFGNGADPFDPAANADAGARFTKANIDGLASAGIEASPGNIYLAHFSGLGGAKKVLSADPTAPVASVLGDDAVTANPFLKNMTVADLRSWADRKMGGGSSTPAAPRPSTGILNQQAAATPSAGPGLLNGAEPQEAEPAIQVAQTQPEQQQVAPLAPIRFVAPKGLDRAKFLAALTARKIA